MNKLNTKKRLTVLPMTVLPILIGVTISLFLSGKIVTMPSDPADRGVWGAIGVAIILLSSFLLSIIGVCFIKKITNKQK